MKKKLIITTLTSIMVTQITMTSIAFAENLDIKKAKFKNKEIITPNKLILININDSNIMNNNISCEKNELNLTGLGSIKFSTLRYNPNTKKLELIYKNTSKNSKVHVYFGDSTFLKIKILRENVEIANANITGNDSYFNANEKISELEKFELKNNDKVIFESSEPSRFNSKIFGTMDHERNKFVVLNNTLNLESVNNDLDKESIFLYNKKDTLMNIITFDTNDNKFKCSKYSDDRYDDDNDIKYMKVKISRNKNIIKEIIINGNDTGQSIANTLNDVSYNTEDEIYFETVHSKAVSSVSSGNTTKYKIVNNKLRPVIGNAPILSANDVTLNVGDKFNPMTGVEALDDEDGNITRDISIIFDNVNTSKIGVYYIHYKIIDNDGNESSLIRTVKVKSNNQIIGNAKIGTYEDFSNMSKIGLNRGNYHGRQSLGFILPPNTRLEVRQVNSNFNDNLTLNLLNDDSHKEKSITIPKNGKWISIENAYESVPFIKKVSSTIVPEIEYRVIGDIKNLPIYKENSNEINFFKEWDASNSNFAFIENDRIQMLVPKKSRNYLRSMPDFSDIDNLFEFYNQLFNKFDYLVGLDKNSTNPLHRNVDTQYFVKANIHGAGSAYYGTDHTAQNGDNINSYLSKGWLPLHELGHGYEYNIGSKGIGLTDVFNNILSHFYERTFKDGDEGWLFGSGNRQSRDISMKNVRESGSYDSSGYGDKLGMFVYLIEFIGEDKFAEFNKLYREKDANGQLDGKNIGEIFREFLSEITGYDFGAYFDAYKIPNNENKDLKNEKYLDNKNVFILGDIVKDQSKAEEIKVEKNLKSNYSLISTEEIMNSSVYLEKGTLNLNIDNIDTADGETVYLKDGNKIIDSIIIDKNKKNIFKNIVPGRYKLYFGNKNSTFNNYSDIKTIDIFSGMNDVNLKSPYSKNGVGLFDQTIKLTGLGDRTFAEIITDLKENKLKIKINSGKPHSYFDELYAKIEIFDKYKNKIYTNDFIGNENQTASTKIIDIKPGYKIKIFHAEPSRLNLIDSDNKTTDFNGMKYTEFILIETGFEYNGINTNERLYRLIDGFASNLRKELGDNIKDYDFYRNHRTILKNAISFLPKDFQKEMFKKYGDIINHKIDNGQGKREVPVIYDVSSTIPDPDNPGQPTYQVLIPSSITFAEVSKPVDVSVSITDGTDKSKPYTGDETVSVKVKSANEYKVAMNGQDKLKYTLSYGSTTMSGTHPQELGQLTKTNLKVKGQAILNDAAKKVGVHADTLTYEVEKQ